MRRRRCSSLCRLLDHIVTDKSSSRRSACPGGLGPMVELPVPCLAAAAAWGMVAFSPLPPSHSSSLALPGAREPFGCFVDFLLSSPAHPGWLSPAAASAASALARAWRCPRRAAAAPRGEQSNHWPEAWAIFLPPQIFPFCYSHGAGVVLLSVRAQLQMGLLLGRAPGLGRGEETKMPHADCAQRHARVHAWACVEYGGDKRRESTSFSFCSSSWGRCGRRRASRIQASMGGASAVLCMPAAAAAAGTRGRAALRCVGGGCGCALLRFPSHRAIVHPPNRW